jgi:hypothetical protein
VNEAPLRKFQPSLPLVTSFLAPSHQRSRDRPPATRAAADHEIDLALETARLLETEASPDLARDPDLAPDRKILPCTRYNRVFLPIFSNLLKRNSRIPRFIEIDYHRSKLNASILGLHFSMKTAVSLSNKMNKCRAMILCQAPPTKTNLLIMKIVNNYGQ